MATSRVVEILTHEHKIILKVVTAATGVAAALREGRQVKVSTLREIVGFMRNFADRCHHAKEEDLLFPALVRAGLPETTGPIAVLKSEHAQARACMGRLDATIDAYEKEDPAAREQIIADIACMGSLYPQHIEKENGVLFPMSEKILSADQLVDLAQQFEATERRLGEKSHDELEIMAGRLTQQAVM
jgi:hemerythrin-like domain-containing protein